MNSEAPAAEAQDAEAERIAVHVVTSKIRGSTHNEIAASLGAGWTGTRVGKLVGRLRSKGIALPAATSGKTEVRLSPEAFARLAALAKRLAAGEALPCT